VTPAPKKYPDEVRSRSIRLFGDLLTDPDLRLSATEACIRVSEQMGINRDPGRKFGVEPICQVLATREVGRLVQQRAG
jgi:hypothetical protein